MRSKLRCPKCECKQIMHVPVVRDNGFNRLMVECRTSFFGDQEYGEYEAYICRACGYAELYVKGVQGIRIEQVDGATLIDGEKEHSTPYR